MFSVPSEILKFVFSLFKHSKHDYFKDTSVIPISKACESVLSLASAGSS